MRGWASFWLFEILVVTFSIYPPPPPYFLVLQGEGVRGEGNETKGYLSFINHNFFHPWSCTEKTLLAA